MKKTRTLFSGNGFSLLEHLLSIGIIALIILMATRYFTTARNAQLVSQAVQQIQAIRASVSSMSAAGVPFGTGTSSAINMGTVCSSGSLSTTDCDKASNALITPWGTSSDTNKVEAGPTADTDLFKLSYAFPNAQTCNAAMNSFTKDLDAPGTTSNCAKDTGIGTFVFLK